MSLTAFEPLSNQGLEKVGLSEAELELFYRGLVLRKGTFTIVRVNVNQKNFTIRTGEGVLMVFSPGESYRFQASLNHWATSHMNASNARQLSGTICSVSKTDCICWPGPSVPIFTWSFSNPALRKRKAEATRFYNHLFWESEWIF